MRNRTPLSVALITFNEEDRITACLESVRFADDIVIVDSGSTDRTVSVAENLKARVYVEDWKGYGSQKQSAVDKCENNWVLILDADELLPQETADEIIQILGRNSEYVAYSFPRKNFFLGKWMRYGGWWPDRIVRLFDKRYCHLPPKVVHEEIVVKGSVGKMSNPIVHHTTRGLYQTLEKVNKYSTAGAEELFAKGKKSSTMKAFLHGAWAFVHSYFFRLGFLDGSQGFTAAVTDGVNKFLKFAKLKELNEKAGK